MHTAEKQANIVNARKFHKFPEDRQVEAQARCDWAHKLPAGVQRGLFVEGNQKCKNCGKDMA